MSAEVPGPDRRGHDPGWATTAPPAGLRILLTESDPASRGWMRASLERAGCGVQAVPDGRGTVEAAAVGWFFDLSGVNSGLIGAGFSLTRFWSAWF